MTILSILRTKNRPTLLHLLATTIALGAALAQFTRFLFIAFSRIAFPFSLEWMEGGSLVQVSRILAGQSLYVKPSFDFIPQIYPPVYFYLSALVSEFIGNSFLPLRLVSILATLGILFLIYDLVHKQTRSRLGGILASGFFCATYQLTGHWFDIARVDSLALAFLLLAAVLLLKDKPSASMIGGIFLALTCLTKQTMLIMAGVFAIYCLLPPRKNSLLFLGVAAVVFLSGTLLLNRLSEGWYFYYIFHLPGRHNVLPKITTLLLSSKDILFEEILKPVFIAMLIGLVYLFLFPAKRRMSDTHSQSENFTPNPVWSRRAVWTLALIIEIWAIASFWYLASLPSDAEQGIIGPYSIARLILMTGPAAAGVLTVALAIKMYKTPAWINAIANRLFGNILIVPCILLCIVILAAFSIIFLAYVRLGLYEGLNTSTLQRLSPYLVGPVLFLAVTVVCWRFLWTSHRLEPWFFLLLGFGLVGTSWLGRLNPGGYYNVFMTAYAGIAILFGLGIGFILQGPLAGVSLNRSIFGITVLLLSSAQLSTLLSSPMPQIPTEGDMVAGQELVSRIRACPGEVYIPFHTYLAELAGKKGYAGVVEMGELRGSFGGKADPLWDEVLYQIQDSMDSQKFAAVVQDNQVFRDAMSNSYIETDQVFEKDLVFWPVTGRKIRPETIYWPTNGDGCLLRVE